MISFLFRHSQQSNITKILCHSLVCSVINPRFALIGRKQNSAHSMLYAPSTRLARCVYCLSKIDFDGIRLSKFNVTRCSFCALSWKRKGGGGGGIEQYMILMFNHICGCSCSYFSFQFFSLHFQSTFNTPLCHATFCDPWIFFSSKILPFTPTLPRFKIQCQFQAYLRSVIPVFDQLRELFAICILFHLSTEYTSYAFDCGRNGN